MEEYKKDLGDDYIPLINMTDINNYDNQPQPRPEQQQQQQTLPLENGRATTDIMNMADILLGKQQQLRPRASSSHIGGWRRRRRGNIKKESEDTLTDISSISTITIAI